MRRNTSTALRFLAALSLSALVVPLGACAGSRPAASSNGDHTAAAQLAFGVNMAQRGLWQEALFRFREAERLDPQNPRVQNNLAVASEAAGDFDGALKYYKKALEVDPGNREAKANYARFVEFYQGFKPKPKEPKVAKSAKPGKDGKPEKAEKPEKGEKPGDNEKGDAPTSASPAAPTDKPMESPEKPPVSTSMRMPGTAAAPASPQELP